MRRSLDRYFTPDDATIELLNRVKIEGRVFEPCAGTGQIAKFFKHCRTNDIVGGQDATKPETWEPKNYDWVITNPPFRRAYDILRRALETNARIAFLLRLSFLEPTYERSKLLSEYPPSKIIILPRISFTGDGRTDNVTCAWMLWNYWDSLPIEVVGKK